MTAPRSSIYTRAGDDGTTGLLFGSRVRKDHPAPTAYGDVDEAQAALGLARAQLDPASEAHGLLTDLCTDLWVLMAELATAPENRAKLTPGSTAVTAEMVTDLEGRIDAISARFSPPTGFVIPGGNPAAASCDLARTIVRRAERSALAVAAPPSQAGPYLNRLSDLLWTVARWLEGESVLAADARRSAAEPPETPTSPPPTPGEDRP